MCSSEEFINSRSYPTSAGSAWIRPTYIPVGMGSGHSDVYVAVHDISGVVYSTNSTPGMSCYGWGGGDITLRGLIVDEKGKYGLGRCSDAFKVSCCSPAP